MFYFYRIYTEGYANKAILGKAATNSLVKSFILNLPIAPILLHHLLPKHLHQSLGLFLPRILFLTLIQRKPLYLLILNLLHNPILHSRILCIRLQLLQIVQIIKIVPNTMLLQLMLLKTLTLTLNRPFIRKTNQTFVMLLLLNLLL